MNAYVDQLIDEHNAPFHADCIRATACSTLPVDGTAGLPRVGRNPRHAPAIVFTFDNRDDAEMAAIGAIFCGAYFADITWIDGTSWRQEVWAEVQS